MKRLASALLILRRLLDRHERATSARKIIERPSQTFENPSDLKAMVELLIEAEQAGAIALGWDRDAPHLIDRVTLVDPEPLYRFTGRSARSEILATAVRRLNEAEAVTQSAQAMAQDFVAAWSEGRRFIGLDVEDLDQVLGLLRATDAAFTELPPDIPLRTRSSRLLGIARR